MKKIIILAALAASFSANAQLGLGKIKDKVKETTKKEDKKEEKKDETKSSSSSASGNSSNASTTSKPTETKKEPAFDEKNPFGASKYWVSGEERFVVDNGIKTDLHKNNIEKIVFSKKKLDPATATSADAVTTFNINDNIYGLVFMKTAIGNYKIYNPESKVVKGNPDRNYEVRVFIDGKKATYTTLQNKIDESKKAITCFSENFHCFNPGDYEENSHYFVNEINELPAGNHTIRYELWGGNTNMKGRTMEPIAAGELTLVKKAGEMLKIGRNFSQVKAQKTDKALETQMLARMKQYGEENKTKAIYTAAKITEAEWNIIKNHYGAVLRRSINVSIQSQAADGKCYIVKTTFFQEYVGTAFQKALDVEVEAYEYQIDCN